MKIQRGLCYVKSEGIATAKIWLDEPLLPTHKIKISEQLRAFDYTKRFSDYYVEDKNIATSKDGKIVFLSFAKFSLLTNVYVVDGEGKTIASIVLDFYDQIYENIEKEEWKRGDFKVAFSYIENLKIVRANLYNRENYDKAIEDIYSCFIYEVDHEAKKKYKLGFGDGRLKEIDENYSVIDFDQIVLLKEPSRSLPLELSFDFDGDFFGVECFYDKEIKQIKV